MSTTEVPSTLPGNVPLSEHDPALYDLIEKEKVRPRLRLLCTHVDLRMDLNACRALVASCSKARLPAGCAIGYAPCSELCLVGDEAGSLRPRNWVRSLQFLVPGLIDLA